MIDARVAASGDGVVDGHTATRRAGVQHHKREEPMKDTLRPTLLMLTVLVHAGIAHGIGLPAGFEAVAIPVSLDKPTGFAFAPDGTIYIMEHAGIVRVHDGASQQATPFIDLTAEVNQDGDRGLLGIALHPGFVPDDG